MLNMLMNSEVKTKMNGPQMWLYIISLCLAVLNIADLMSASFLYGTRSEMFHSQLQTNSIKTFIRTEIYKSSFNSS